MSSERPDADALARIAESATMEVRTVAFAASKLLPVWRDNRVVYVDPVTGKAMEIEQRPTPTSQQSSDLPTVLRNLA
jgi:hypothetical protein